MRAITVATFRKTSKLSCFNAKGKRILLSIAVSLLPATLPSFVRNLISSKEMPVASRYTNLICAPYRVPRTLIGA